MKISLLTFTGMGRSDQIWHAADVMIFTKQTRLALTPGLFTEIQGWPPEKKLEELHYMAGTIPSSWEFNDYTFLFEDVTRAFTHQLVRTRTASFAQQTMRVLRMDKWGYLTGPSITGQNKAIYDHTMQVIAEAYDDMVAGGAKEEDARGILPTNIQTNIIMKLNFRTFCEMSLKRMGPRVQGEYRQAVTILRDLVISVHPWAAIFLANDAINASKQLDAAIALNVPDPEARKNMEKLVDKMRTGL